jgi:DNA polymerase-3 subunit delta'
LATHIEAESKQGNISVEESRNVIQTLSLKSFEAEYKILLIWLPEMMNLQSANALLKILEEPPQKTLFLLVSNDQKSLLATILSRVQRVQIPAFSDEEIYEYLKNRLDLEEAKAQEITYLVDANLNEALRLSQESYTKDHHLFFRDWMRACYKKDLNDLVKRADEFASMTKEAQKSLFQYGLGVCRETLLLQNSNEALLRLSGEKLEFIRGFAKTMNFEKIALLYQQLNEAYYHIERNASPKITFVDVSLHLIKIMRLQ